MRGVQSGPFQVNARLGRLATGVARFVEHVRRVYSHGQIKPHESVTAARKRVLIYWASVWPHIRYAGIIRRIVYVVV